MGHVHALKPMTASALMAGALMLAGPAAAFDAVVVVGENCPAGSTHVSFAEAQANKDELCRRLGQWYIARLAGGGSMDGPGYQCRMRAQDTRPLGHSLCKPGASTAGTVTITGCAQPGVESACVTINANNTTYEISGASPEPAWDHWITLTGKPQVGGARICGGTHLTNITWSYAQHAGACPARPANPLRDPGPPYRP